MRQTEVKVIPALSFFTNPKKWSSRTRQMWWEKHLVEALLRIVKQPHGLWLMVWGSSGIDGKIGGGRWVSSFVKRGDHHCTTQDVDFGSIALHFPGTKRVNGWSRTVAWQDLRIPGCEEWYESEISEISLCSPGAKVLLWKCQAKVIGANITREITLGGARCRLQVFFWFCLVHATTARSAMFMTYDVHVEPLWRSRVGARVHEKLMVVWVLCRC